MSKTKHTPGPWKIAGEDKTFVYASGPLGTNSFWASVQFAGPERISKHEAEANALLIAAAPDSHESNMWLLDAVKCLLSGKPVHDMDERIAYAEKIIAKIEGEV